MASVFFTPRRLGVEWLDADGEELTAVVLDRTENSRHESTQEARPRTGASGLGANQETVLKALRRLYRVRRKKATEDGLDPAEAQVLLDGLRNDVVERLLPAKRFSEAVDALLGRGLIRVDGAHVLLAESAE